MYLTHAFLCFYKSYIKPKMEYCYHIWPGTAQSSFFSLDRVQKRLCVLVDDKIFSTFQLLSHRHNLTSLSLLYRHFQVKCSDELHSLILPVLTLTTRTRHATHIVTNLPYSLRIPMVINQFHSNSFFHEPLTYITDSQGDASPMTTILTCSSQPLSPSPIRINCLLN